MKNSKITYFFISSALLVVVVGYWYVTRAGAVSSTQRKFIASNEVKPSPAVPASVPITKKDAYEERFKESAEDKAKLDFVLENQRPQKLAESVTRAMKSPYQKKLDELKSERSTVPVYDGKSYPDTSGPVPELMSKPESVPEQWKEQPLHPVKKKAVHRSSGPSRNMEKGKSNPIPVQGTSEEVNVFNTTSVEISGSAPNSSAEAKELEENGGIIKAAVFGEQAIKSGGSLKFRLLEKVTIEGNTFDRNTFFSGQCTFGQDRLLVIVDKMPASGGGYKKVELIIHDPNDFQEGLFAPSDKAKEGAVDAASNSVEKIISGVGTPGMNLGAGVARIFKTAVNGTQKITVPDGHQVIFLTKIL